MRELMPDKWMRYLKLLIKIMVKDDEARDYKLKETERFTKEEATAELYAWIRKTYYA